MRFFYVREPFQDWVSFSFVVVLLCIFLFVQKFNKCNVLRWVHLSDSPGRILDCFVEITALGATTTKQIKLVRVFDYLPSLTLDLHDHEVLEVGH